jgi:hypothetical protein
MGNRFERDQGRAEAGRSSNNMMQLFGQMIMLPLTVFVYGMELFVRAIQGVQRVTDEGMGVMVGASDQTRTGVPTNQSQPTNRDAINEGVQAVGSAQGSLSAPANQTTTSTNDSTIGDGAETNQEETRKMRDTNLTDDMLKLVRYKILFVKRDYEFAFPEREELVSDNMNGSDFTAWKIAEFIQRLGRRPPEVRVPDRWRDKNYPAGKHSLPKDEHEAKRLADLADKAREEAEAAKGKPEEKAKKERANDAAKAAREAGAPYWLIGFPEEDKKYLRVFYEVLERYPREKFKYEEDQITVLKEIRDRL